MTVVTIRPLANASGFGQTAVNTGGAGSGHAAVADNSDSTYLAEASGPAPGTFGYTFGASGLAASDVILNVAVRMRYEKTSGTPSTGPITLLDPVTGKTVSFSKSIGSATPATYAATPFTSIGGKRWTQAMVDRLVIYGAVQPNLRLYEIYVDITYNSAPVLSGLSPSGTYGIASPLFAWTYTDPDGDMQAKVDIVVYTAATVAALGLTSTPDASLASVYEAAAEGAESPFPVRKMMGIDTTQPYYNDPTLILPPGAYRFYVRAGDAATSGKRRGAWAYSDFTIATAPPPAPRVIAGAYDPIFGRVPLRGGSYDNLLTYNYAGAENATGDYSLGNCTATLDTTSSKLWSPPGGPTLSAKSLKTTTTSNGGVTVLAPLAAANSAPVVAGQLYVAGAHVFSTTARLATATIEWFNAANANIGTTAGISIPTATGTAPACIFACGVAPAGAVRAGVLITVASTLASENHWFDDFFVVATDVVAEQLCSTWNGNLVSNTSFETYAGSSGAADWGTSSSGGSQSVNPGSGSSAADGAQRMVIAKQETSLAPPYAEWPKSTAPALPVTAGDVLIITGYQKAVAVSPGITVEVVYQDAAHHEVTCTAATSTTWEPFIVAVEIPSGKTSCTVRFLPVAVGASGSQGTVEIDAINIYKAPSAVVTAFHALGGASGTPKGAGLGNTLTPFTLGSPYQPFFPWVQGGYRTAATFAIRRSVDGGQTWEAVRGTATFGTTFYDYEATPNTVALNSAQEVTADPVSAAVVGSPEILPMFADPGFETQFPWTGIDTTDTWANAFQPVYGTKVGGITRPSDLAVGSYLKTATGPLPTWATSIRLRMLVRTVNCQAPIVRAHWLDLTGVESFVASTFTLVSVPGTTGDSGWAWFDQTIAVPPFATSYQLEIDGPAPVDSAKAQLAVFDAVYVIPIAADGSSPAANVPVQGCDAWLKDPLNPAANMKVNVEVAGLSGSGNASASGTEMVSTESQLVIQPAGRATPVVLADTVVSSESFGTLQFVLANDQEWAAIEGLRKAQRTLLLQLPYGDLAGVQYYLRLGGTRTAGIVQTQDQQRNQRRRLTISAVQVDAP